LSIFDSFFGNRESKRVMELEKRVSDLESELIKATLVLKQLAELSLQTGKELENLSEYIRRKEAKVPIINTPKKPDDFYN